MSERLAPSEGVYSSRRWEDSQLVTSSENNLSTGGTYLCAVGEGGTSGSSARAVSESPQRRIVCLGPLDGQAAERAGVIVGAGPEGYVTRTSRISPA